MKSLKKTSVIQYGPDTLQEVRKLFDLDNPGRLDESIDILHEWIQKQPHFNKKDFDRDFLERFIIRAKGSVEKAKQRLDSYCAERTMYPHVFKPIRANTITQLETLDEALLPRQTADFCSIFLLRTREQTFDSTYYANYYSRVISLYEYLYRYDYSAGVIVILDYRKCNMPRLIASLSNPYIPLSFDWLTKSLGARFRGVHIFANSKLAEAFATLLTKFLSSKMKRLHFHSNFETLYDHVDRELLPEDYGGKEKPLHELATNMLEFLSTDEVYDNLKDSASATIDTSIKPLQEEVNLDYGVPGTFRSLAVD